MVNAMVRIFGSHRAAADDRRLSACRHGGMTLIEVVVILLVLGILALAVTSRLGTGAVNLTATTDKVAADLRLVQAMAMNSSPGIWGLRFERAGQTYYLFHCPDPSACDMAAGIRALPGASVDHGLRVPVSDGKVRLQTDTHVAYDDHGRPLRITGAAGRLITEPIRISFRDQEGNTDAVDITPQTGFIP